ncbi:mitogen-activated protein kinase kinase kinase 5-like [Cryptomeria japonica]|uniref:mitogen-activated protein kinase kinase kinase 5-like n=1 Tax=Cryptomeria japonica TaxID=3369 RepID=UPI0027DAB02B|nr:mitogen-activated protein kinase kinase kinase 5-like [Cryptomeria japonica]
MEISCCAFHAFHVPSILQSLYKQLPTALLPHHRIQKRSAMGTKSNAGSWLRGTTIGAGAFGTVSLAINNSNGELFAVKSMAAGSVSCLQHEFNILKSLNSPYIVRCLGMEYSNENGVEMCNLMMEYMPGGSLGDLLSKFGGQLDESVIRSYTRGILRGLDYLHRQGIVHCDIKGKNVLVGSCGVVKLGDFGSARRTEEKGQMSVLRGTPLWMAPEVVNQVEQGPPSDIWSLGCTVVEMATGRSPWTNASNPLAALYLIGCSDELPELPACLSPQGRDFLDKCFRRDPKQRWTAAQLLEHPFLSQIDCCSVTEAKRAPLSPTSTLNFGSPDWDSASSSSVPILSLAIARLIAKAEAEEEKESVKRPSFSAKNRLAALAACGERPDWCASPQSEQWITVRSSSPLSKTGNISVEAVCNYSLQNRNQEMESCVTSAMEDSEAGVDHRKCEKAFKAITGLLIVHQAHELYRNSSEHAARHHGYNKFHTRENLCASGTNGCRTCCFLFVSKHCSQKSVSWQLGISFTTDAPLIFFISQLILIHMIWLHGSIQGIGDNGWPIKKVHLGGIEGRKKDFVDQLGNSLHAQIGRWSGFEKDELAKFGSGSKVGLEDVQ